MRRPAEPHGIRRYHRQTGPGSAAGTAGTPRQGPASLQARQRIDARTFPEGWPLAAGVRPSVDAVRVAATAEPLHPALRHGLAIPPIAPK